MSYGFRVIPSPDLGGFDRQRLQSISTTDLSDAMFSSGTMSTRIRPLSLEPGTRIVGRALTISVPTGSVAVLRVGMQMARPGEIIVVNGCGIETTTLVGGNMLRAVLRRGAAGFVADGAIRDLEEVKADGLPVFARAVAMRHGPNGPDHGEVNVPIACGNTVVNPGDIIVADADGVVAIPSDDVDSIATRAEEFQARYAAMQATIEEGNLFGAEATVKALRADGCEFAAPLESAFREGRQEEVGRR